MQSLQRLKELTGTPAFRSEMETAFFEAMNAGYATDAPKKKSILWLPGSKTIEYIRDSWRVVDSYHVTALGPRSGGTTIISYEETPVWMMQYLGQYDEAAIPCLKAALRAAYAEKEFFGGRGPDEFVHGEFVYHNEVDRAYRADFQTSNFFKGYEKITKVGRDADGTTQKAVGWHSYQGMMMI